MTDRDSLWELQLFTEVVESGSIAGAARARHVTPSAISKRLAALEARLGVRLLQRTTRRLRVTPAGAELKERASKVLSALEEAEASVQRGAGALSGVVRVSAPTVLGQELIAPRLAEFCLKHPTVSVELQTSDRFVDLVAEPIDIAVRVAARLPSSGLLVRKLAELPWVLACSPAYVKTHGEPHRPSDLSAHRVLELAHAVERARMTLSRGVRTYRPAVKGPFVANGLGALRHAAVAGLGIAAFPRWFIAKELAAARLTEVLPHYRLPERAVWLVQPSRAFVPPRVRAVVDWLFAKPLTQS